MDAGPSDHGTATLSARRARWPDRIAVGRVVKAHGVRGELAIEPWGEFASRLQVGESVHIGEASFQIGAVRGTSDRPLISLVEIGDRETAAALRGRLIQIASSRLDPPADGDLYLFELEGCTVFVADPSGSETPGRRLGSVTQVIEDGGGLLLEVSGADPQEPSRDALYLLPFVDAYLDHMDLAEGLLSFTLPEGLLETCASTS